MSAVAPETLEKLESLAPVSRETMERLHVYVRLLEKWNPGINLVSPKTVPEVWERHILDSAQLWPLIPDAAKTITDLGSGGGFPGLVLAILGAERDGFHVNLVESDQRKCAFLREVSRETSARATVHTARIEEIDPLLSDVVTARALAPLHRLLPLAAPFVREGGIALFLKGKSARDELTAVSRWGTFEVEVIQSRTDMDASILKLSQLKSAD